MRGSQHSVSRDGVANLGQGMISHKAWAKHRICWMYNVLSARLEHVQRFVGSGHDLCLWMPTSKTEPRSLHEAFVSNVISDVHRKLRIPPVW